MSRALPLSPCIRLLSPHTRITSALTAGARGALALSGALPRRSYLPLTPMYTPSLPPSSTHLRYYNGLPCLGRALALSPCIPGLSHHNRARIPTPFPAAARGPLPIPGPRAVCATRGPDGPQRHPAGLRDAFSPEAGHSLHYGRRRRSAATSGGMPQPCNDMTGLTQC